LANRLASRPVLSPGRVVEPGTRLPEFVLTSFAGGVENRVAYDEAPEGTVLYVFSPQCGWCRRNEANIAALRTCTEGRYAFKAVAVNREGMLEYFQGAPPYPVLLDESRELVTVARVKSTPTTIVTSRDGVVLAGWAGAFQYVIESDLESYFECQLPGVGQRP
jgi:hypothetical protein